MTDDNEARFNRWVREHLGLLGKVVRAFSVLPQDREDLLQEMLINLWSSLPRFRGESKETTWIYRVAFNTALAWKRGEQRQRERKDLWVQQVGIPAALHPENSSPRHALIERMYAAIRQLPQIDASLALMHLEGLSYEEMADVLGISENYVGVKLNRIRKELADQLQGESDEL